MNLNKVLYTGKTAMDRNISDVNGEIVEICGTIYYKISNYNEIPPFLMSIVSDSDHWLFVSSTGGVTCGRRNPENALFPYDSDDKIHDASQTTGPKTIITVSTDEQSFLWEPFSNSYAGCYKLERNLYKSIYANSVLFEEINHTLNIRYTYAWKSSDKYGFVKESQISLTKEVANISIDILDGVRNILPYGVDRMMQLKMSTLVDGYKKCELIKESNLGIYTLSSIVADKAEPSEALKASVVWSKGLSNCRILLSENQVDNFEKGLPVNTESDIIGKRGAYYVNSSFSLTLETPVSWVIVSDVSQGPSDIPQLIRSIESESLIEEIKKDIDKGTEKLKQLVASSDGIQHTGSKLVTGRHFSNVMFNIMRGGVFTDGYNIPKDDYCQFIKKWNGQIYKKHKEFLDSLESYEHQPELLSKVKNLKDTDLIRLTMEYLPLTFCRKHGDPSRPWNHFSIDIKDEFGNGALNYQGNWRDIFQNWESLSLSYPEFIECFIAKFVNASTADGYNPHKISKDGVAWEYLNPDDPWSNIGYWGDHQMIYLLKFLEMSREYHPGKLEEMLVSDIFVYANVPYRIIGYDELIKRPHESICFSDEIENYVDEQCKKIGFDGKLLLNSEWLPYKVNLLEKILVSVLAKLSNFVPGGGIWMNTQRPEWNDANNALVSYGLSMVTLCYLRRMQAFMLEVVRSAELKTVKVSIEVAEMMQSVFDLLENNKAILNDSINGKSRRAIIDGLGYAGNTYRNKIYSKGFSGKKSDTKVDTVAAFFELTLKYLDHTIALSKRDDGLYHAYNLVSFNSDSCEVEPLQEMLEGQVAVLTSGYLDAASSVQLLESLRNSRMYRADQNSYMLYPDKKLKGFLEKNVIPTERIKSSHFLQKQLDDNIRRIIEKDINGNVHFNGKFRNSIELKEALLAAGDISSKELVTVCSIFDDIFDHRRFTGRSGAFYKYEGLGCIYWHMVSKLLLAVQEIYFKNISSNIDSKTMSALKHHYFAIRSGLGTFKSPAEYGAIPTDPYSHTPGFTGAQQPGMTGQVKEDIITRFVELGVKVKSGEINFAPYLLPDDEWLQESDSFTFSLCGIPVIYRKSSERFVEIKYKDGRISRLDGLIIDTTNSMKVFERSNSIAKITVRLCS